MLILTRTLEKQGIVFRTSNGPIRVYVQPNRNGFSAKVGIEAPPSVHVLREELTDDTPRKVPPDFTGNETKSPAKETPKRRTPQRVLP